MIDKQQLQAMGEHQAEQHMCMAKQIEDLQTRLQECANGAAKMQEQRDAAYVMAGKSGLERDKFAQQLKAANRKIAVMAESLREAVSALSSINHGREHKVIIDDEPAFWQRDEWVSWATGDVLPMLRADLSCELPAPSVEVTETIRTAPARIWLQVGDQSHYHSEPFPSDTGEVTWCADSVVACEVPYVRADLTGGHHSSLEGWQPVPVEPTPEMLEEIWLDSRFSVKAMKSRYKAVLAAAPKPEQTK